MNSNLLREIFQYFELLELGVSNCIFDSIDELIESNQFCHAPEDGHLLIKKRVEV